jgi:hypothetical protein
MTAVIAGAAGNVVKNNHPIPRLELADASADGGDHSRGFVAEDARGGMRSSGNLLEVGAANAAGVYTQQKFPGAYLGDRDGFQANIVDAAVNSGKHGRWNRLASIFYCDLSGNPHYVLNEFRRTFIR